MALSQTGFVGTIHVGDVAREIANNTHLFGEYPQRAEAPGSPHAEMSDIWLRYGDISEMVRLGDFSKIGDEHDSVWLNDMPDTRRACFDVMALVDGERLGGVLITRLPPAGRIKPHRDSGWHASYYDKFFVPIENEPGAVFGFEDRNVDPSPGDVWQFNNSRTHWVNNDSDADRIAMVVCVKTERSFYG